MSSNYNFDIFDHNFQQTQQENYLLPNEDTISHEHFSLHQSISNRQNTSNLSQQEEDAFHQQTSNPPQSPFKTANPCINQEKTEKILKTKAKQSDLGIKTEPIQKKFPEPTFNRTFMKKDVSIAKNLFQSNKIVGRTSINLEQSNFGDNMVNESFFQQNCQINTLNFDPLNSQMNYFQTNNNNLMTNISHIIPNEEQELEEEEEEEKVYHTTTTPLIEEENFILDSQQPENLAAVNAPLNKELKQKIPQGLPNNLNSYTNFIGKQVQNIKKQQLEALNILKNESQNDINNLQQFMANTNQSILQDNCEVSEEFQNFLVQFQRHQQQEIQKFLEHRQAEILQFIEFRNQQNQVFCQELEKKLQFVQNNNGQQLQNTNNIQLNNNNQEDIVIQQQEQQNINNIVPSVYISEESEYKEIEIHLQESQQQYQQQQTLSLLNKSKKIKKDKQDETEFLKNLKIKSMDYLVLLMRLYLLFNEDSNIKFEYSDKRIEEILKKQKFISDAQIKQQIQNIQNFQSEKLKLDKNAHKNTTRTVKSDLIQFQSKTLLDLRTILHKAYYFYSNDLGQKFDLGDCDYFSAQAKSKTNKNLRDLHKKIKKISTKLPKNYYKENISIIDILNNKIPY